MSIATRLNALAFAITGKSFSGFTASWLRGDESTLLKKRPRLTQPYSQSAYIRAAVNKVAGEISGQPLKFYLGEKEYEDAAFEAWWEAPALGVKTLGANQPRLSQAEVKRDCAAWAKLEGEFFLCFDDEWLLARRQLAALSPFLIARPDRMAEIVVSGVLSGWRYTDAGGQQIVFLPEQVVHWKGFSPYDDFRGVGDLQAALIAADSAFLTSVYMRNLMRNNGDQGAIVIGKNGVINKDQREQIAAALREKRAMLERGEAKDLFLTGDITVDRPTEQSAGDAVLAAKAMSHEEIFLAFGVPPSMSASKQSYSVGKESDRYELITTTCQPLGAAIASSFAKIATRQTGKALTAELDWDDHPVMIEVRNSRIDTLIKLTTVGMPVKNANDYLGAGMKPFPGWEQGYLPFSVSPVDASAAPKTDPTVDPSMSEDDPMIEDPQLAALRLMVLARARTNSVPVCRAANDPFAMFICSHGDAGVEQKERSKKEIARWKTLMAQRLEVVRGYQSRFTKELMKARSEVLRKIASSYKPAEKSAVTRAAAADFIFNLDTFKRGLLAEMRKQAAIALETSASQLLKEIGQDDAFKFTPEEVLDFVRLRENKLSGVADDVFSRIRESIEEGLNSGDTSDQLASRIRSEFNAIDKGRSKTIAVTETAAAYGTGREAAMKKAGVSHKQWLTSGNANVRAAHAAANGQTVAVDDYFEVGGEQLQFPGDPEGSPENIINCHCVSIAVEAPEGNQ